MLKRTKGRLLLTLLVITGLAGTLKDTSLSHKERKSAMNLMKSTRMDVLKNVKGLSTNQLNFKTTGNWSIKDCIYHIASSEKNLWAIIETSLKKQSNPEKRSEIKITDEELIKMVEDKNFKISTVEVFVPKNISYKSLNSAVNAFRSRRSEHINYIKLTTEDLRNHVVQMPFGLIDCYQVCLMAASLTNRYSQQIDEIKTDPNFPKK